MQTTRTIVAAASTDLLGTTTAEAIEESAAAALRRLDRHIAVTRAELGAERVADVVHVERTEPRLEVSLAGGLAVVTAYERVTFITVGDRLISSSR